MYRELISKIQTMRKEAGFEVMDHISRVRRTTTIPSPASSRNMQTRSKGEVLADSITLGQMAGYAKEWNINGETVMLGVAKSNKIIRNRRT